MSKEPGAGRPEGGQQGPRAAALVAVRRADSRGRWEGGRGLACGDSLVLGSLRPRPVQSSPPQECSPLRDSLGVGPSPKAGCLGRNFRSKDKAWSGTPGRGSAPTRPNLHPREQQAGWSEDDVTTRRKASATGGAEICHKAGVSTCGTLGHTEKNQAEVWKLF